MTHRVTGLVCAAMAVIAWGASAEAQERDRKATSGAACTPVVELTGVRSSSTALSLTGAQFSTQVGSSETKPPLMFVCPLVRDDLDSPFPVTLGVRVNTMNRLAVPGEDFACTLKVVDRRGALVADSGEVIIDVGFGSKELTAGIVSVSTDDVYLLTCRVPNMLTTPIGVLRSGIISYKWTEESL